MAEYNNYTFNKDFIVLGYRYNEYTNKKDEQVEQYILNIAYEYEKIIGLQIGEAYISKEVLGDITLDDKLEGTVFHATCSYYKPLKRLFIEKINSVDISTEELGE